MKYSLKSWDPSSFSRSRGWPSLELGGSGQHSLSDGDGSLSCVRRGAVVQKINYVFGV